MLEELELKNCADTLVGSTLVKGISGGEKRRVSIGIELLTDPPVIFLDGKNPFFLYLNFQKEPTSGLDSHTAKNIIQLMQRQSR